MSCSTQSYITSFTSIESSLSSLSILSISSISSSSSSSSSSESVDREVDIYLMICAIELENYTDVYNLLKKAARKNYYRRYIFNSQKLLFYACRNIWTNLIKKGKTAFYRACHIGCVETVDILIDFGANWKVIDNKGKTPLFYAMARKKPKIQHRLIAEKLRFLERD